MTVYRFMGTSWDPEDETEYELTIDEYDAFVTQGDNEKWMMVTVQTIELANYKFQKEGN